MKEAKKARHRELQAEYNRTYSERVAKMKGDDPYYDEEYYAAGHYEEDYDDDGYRVDRRADRQQREMPSNSWRISGQIKNLNCPITSSYSIRRHLPNIVARCITL